MKMKIRKIASVLLVLSIVLLSMVGCANNENEDIDFAEDISQTSDEYNYDVSVFIDGEEYAFPMLWSEFKERGWYFPTRNVGVGVDGVYGYDAYQEDNSFEATVANDNLYLTDIDAYLCNYKSESAQWEDCMVAGLRMTTSSANGLSYTANGITLGETTRYEVVEKFGEPAKKYSGNELYYLIEYDNMQNRMVLDYDENDVVREIEIVNVIANKFEDDSQTILLNNEKYNVIPDELSNNPYDFIFEINGNLYKWPITPSVLTDSGLYYADEDMLENVIASRKSAEITISDNNNQTAEIELYNFTDSAIKAKDCPIKSLNLGYGSGTFKDFKIFNGYTYGSSKDEIREYLRDNEYEFYDLNDDAFEILNGPYNDDSDDLVMILEFSEADTLKSVSIRANTYYFERLGE